MTKKQIITISLLTGLLALIIILFSAVFCLRNQYVSWIVSDEQRTSYTTTISNQDIKNAAGLKNGSGIFTINKNNAIDKLESTYPYLKVIQIKTESLVSIKFVLRERIAMYYTTFDSKYYIMDEDLKVLEIETLVPTDLTEIKQDILNVTQNTKKCDFLGDDFYKDTLYNLFISVYEAVKIEDNYLTRAEISELITYVDFDMEYTLKGSYKIIELTTKYGIKVSIGKPTNDLKYKINVCFSYIEQELSDEEKTSGEVRCYYDKDDVEKFVHDRD